MVVAIFIKELRVGGAEKQSLLLTRELQNRHKTFLVVWSNKVLAPPYRTYISENGLSVIFLRGNWLQKICAFIRILKREKVTHLFNFLLINNFVGGLAGRMVSVPNIYGGIRNCELAPSKLVWQRWLHNHISHKTIFNNHSGAQNLSKSGFREEKMIVIHNGLDEEMERCVQTEDAKLTILTAARFLPQKDHLTALKAMQLLQQRGLIFNYVMAGYGEQEAQIREWIVQLGLTQHVKVATAPTNLSRLFGRAHLYLSCSLKEGLSNSIMEALSAALPVVATDVGDNNRLIEDGENGILVATGAPEQIANAIEQLAADVTLRKEMGNAGYNRLKHYFSTELFLKNYLELIEK